MSSVFLLWQGSKDKGHLESTGDLAFRTATAWCTKKNSEFRSLGRHCAHVDVLIHPDYSLIIVSRPQQVPFETLNSDVSLSQNFQNLI